MRTRPPTSRSRKHSQKRPGTTGSASEYRQVPAGDSTSHPARLQTTTETTPGTGRRIRDEPLHPHTRHGKRTGTPAHQNGRLPFCLVLRPEIEAGKLNIQTSDLDIKIARAGYLPTLSLSAGIGTSHANGNDFTFSEQVKQNWNNSLGFTVSVPIFSNRQTKSAVEKAKIQKQTSELDLLDDQKTLYKTIETLWLDANSAQQRYAAATEKLKSTQTSYELIQEQFNLGMKNTVELLTEKSNLLSAQQETLQAKYMAILNMQLLKFYQGEKIEL